ncbi:hypothetical protein [Brachybacterium alimentarium]|uniref:hypothetical protein n=1 Tax=Brachybacterium alimentarium TaxID=47845 RepID=UPI000DF33556|nr:hypothetical protein [Brachybacterium alimentarium]RCS76348.1 hypothetical protein CIK70_15930 [Brachybacterium alimentarium]
MELDGAPDFPTRLPTVTVDVVEAPTSRTVHCDELQWWFVVPRVGDISRAAWYDRDTGELTRTRGTARPVAASAQDDDSVAIEIDERLPRSQAAGPEHNRISMAARLGRERAEFLSITSHGRTTDRTDRDFASNWGATGNRLLADAERLHATGPGSYRSVGSQGPRVDLVELTVGDRIFHGLRILDLDPGEDASEFGQSIVDLESGRTLAYWQYRPSPWDDDSGAWLATRPGVGLTIDGIRYQRRNCTGRDEVALTDHALFP